MSFGDYIQSRRDLSAVEKGRQKSFGKISSDKSTVVSGIIWNEMLVISLI